MPIVIHEQSGDQPPVQQNCADLSLVSPEDTLRDGCPVLGKSRMVVVAKGQCATVRWALRDRQGQAVSLVTCLECPGGEVIDPTSSSSSSLADCEPGQILARFDDALGVSPVILQIVGTAYDLQAGVVDIPLSEDLVAVPGIYRMEIGITNGSQLIFSELGYLSVERGLFGDTTPTYQQIGPPTLQEIRTQLRDTLLENDLLGAAEFSDLELIHSILRPIQEWNETPPPVAVLNAGNFPFRNAWMNAIVANCLMIAAHWYERNRLPASHGGITVDDRNKANPYLLVAQMLRKEWKEFVQHKKIQINVERASGTVGSSYYYGG